MVNHIKNNLSRFNSFISIIVNIFILIMINIYYYQVFFLSSDFYKWLPIFNIMIGVSIIGYFSLFIINTEKFRLFIELTTALFGVWGFYNLYKIFPFNFTNLSYYNFTRLIIIFVIIGCFIGFLVNFIKLLLNK